MQIRSNIPSRFKNLAIKLSSYKNIYKLDSEGEILEDANGEFVKAGYYKNSSHRPALFTRLPQATCESYFKSANQGTEIIDMPIKSSRDPLVYNSNGIMGMQRL